MKLSKAMDLMCNVIACRQEYLTFSKGYDVFEKAYEELKEEGQLVREEYQDGLTTMVKITSTYPSLLRKIKQNARKEDK